MQQQINGNFYQFFINSFNVLLFWVSSIVNPLSFNLIPGQRIAVISPDFSTLYYNFFSILLFIFSWQLIKKFKQKNSSKYTYAFISTLLLLLCYLLLISLGRTQQKNLEYVINLNTYYQYFFSKLLIILFVISFHEYLVSTSKRFYLTIFILMSLIVINLIKLEIIQFQQFKIYAASRLKLIHFINQTIHQKGKTIRFNILNCPQNPTVFWPSHIVMINSTQSLPILAPEFQALYPFNFSSTDYQCSISCDHLSFKMVERIRPIPNASNIV